MEQPFATLPVFSDYDANGETYRYDVCLYRADHNICEQEDAGPCDTAAGVYYSSSDPMGGKLCPRHFYEMHFGGSPPECRLVDPLGKVAPELLSFALLVKKLDPSEGLSPSQLAAIRDIEMKIIEKVNAS